jgi:hypothetical protein
MVGVAMVPRNQKERRAVNIKCRQAMIQVDFDTGRYRQPPKTRGWVVECHVDGEHRIVEIVPQPQGESRWRILSARTFGPDNGFPSETHFRPMSRKGYTLDEAKQLAREFCETRQFRCVRCVTAE